MKFLMLESVFFITLGISCILLLMLIYHFKQRLSKLEQNNETMFEILNNIVQELTDMKRYSSIHNSAMQNQYNQEKINVNLDDDDDIPDLNTINDEDNSQVIDDKLYNNKIPLEKNNSEDESDYESDNESIDKSEDESQEESDDETTISENEVFEEVKTVSVDIDNSLDEINEDKETSHEVQEEYDNDNLEEVNLNTEEIDSLKVSKLDEINNLEENSSNDSDSTNKDVYKKMTVPALKALVIEKGLTTETNKLKKNDLIDLLESNA